ncbi:hypothetical protein tloyanaT_26100 [Thalassotalea loyana]|uniref:Zinc finger DksA/TraR C4-type domain-containing protein n=1 Tax=Thalassotalea loyana TaxID=280483 RepID=A0ABQ6HHX8_9GAMM|nr:TraR/DksA C4-type zinc finger protein [Thalassotalea loyana]GLX86357.1 hypothetical protein tloyanaT_26100 [Thalassotalea loyana]
MADVADKAKLLEQQALEHALASHQVSVETPNEFDGHRYCLDCDIEITTKRLLAAPNAVRCIDCQEVHEHQQKRGR